MLQLRDLNEGNTSFGSAQGAHACAEGVQPPPPMMVSANITSCSTEDSFKYTLYGCVFSMVFVLGLLSNCVAMYIFTCTLKVRNETTTYMINLAISDLLFVFTLPFRIFYFVARQWPFGDTLCKISVTLFYTNMYGSILFLTCISVDRFLAIVHPFRSKTIRTKRKAKAVCLAVWLTVIAGSVPASFFRSTNAHHDNATESCFENFSKDTWKTYLSKIVIFIEIVGFLIPLIVNVFCSAMVLRILRRPVTLSRSKLSKAKVLKMIVVHLAIFIFCFVPYNVNLVLYSLMRTQALSNCAVVRAVRTMYPVTLCIAVSNCCFDPVVYYFTSETIQNSIKKRSWSRRKGSRFSETLPTENFIQHNLQTLKAKMFINESTI
ncbi:lysophosphatidic acid receptor 6 [Pleurodeles waltl]